MLLLQYFENALLAEGVAAALDYHGDPGFGVELFLAAVAGKHVVVGGGHGLQSGHRCLVVEEQAFLLVSVLGNSLTN